MVNKNDRMFIIFSGVTIILLAIVLACAVIAIILISPDIEDLFSGFPIAEETPGGNLYGRQLAYICCPGDNTIRAVDPSTRLVVATMHFNETPYLAMPNPNGIDVYVAAGKNLYIVSTKDINTRNKLAYPDPVRNIEFNSDGRIVYFECGSTASSYLLAVSTADLQLLDSMQYVPATHGKGMAISPDGKYLYVADQLHEELAIISLYNYTLMRPVPCLGIPGDVAVSPDGLHVYVGLMASKELMVVNTDKMVYEKTMDLPVNNPYCVAVSPDGKHVYIAEYDSGVRISTVTVIDTEGHIQKEVPIGILPVDLEVSPDGRSLYVCTSYDPVQVIDTGDYSSRSLGFVGSHIEFSHYAS